MLELFFFLRQISYIAPAGLGFPVWLRVAVSPSSSLPSLESWDLRACTAMPGFKVFSSFFESPRNDFQKLDLCVRSWGSFPAPKITKLAVLVFIGIWLLCFPPGVGQTVGLLVTSSVCVSLAIGDAFVPGYKSFITV